MSYTAQDAQYEFESLQDEALQTRDIEKAIEIREIFAEQGDDEQADYWNSLAKQWDKEDWSYDESIGN